MGREALGELEHQVLLAILRLGDEAYSVSVVQELEEQTGRSVAQAAVFIAMRRLEAKELLSSRVDDQEIPGRGRIRRYFELSPLGLEKVREVRRSLVSLWDGLSTKLDGAG
jgi:PadR family transcriptional regulator PadR